MLFPEIAGMIPCVFRSVKHDEHSLDDECGLDVIRMVSLTACLIILLCMSLAIAFLGPTAVLHQMLHILPYNPGWGWYCAWTVFIITSIVCILPIWSAMCIASGAMFGLYWGYLLNVCSIILGAVSCFLLGRTLLKEPVRRWLREGDYPNMNRMLRVLEDREESLKFQILFRFLCIPMFVRNYGPATLEIPLRTLIIGTIPHSLWVSGMFASLGVAFKDVAAVLEMGPGKSNNLHWQHFLMPAVSISISIGLSYYAYKNYIERLAEEEETALLTTGMANLDESPSEKDSNYACA